MRAITRLSIRVGPIYFKISKLGTSVSAGVRGARLGLSPRGNYIRIGSEGIRYAYTTSNKNSIPHRQVCPEDVTHGPQIDIKSDEANSIFDSSSLEIINEINKKRKRINLFWFVAIFSASIAAYAAYKNLPTLIIAIMGLILCVITRQIDLLRKTCIAMYDMDDDFLSMYDALLDSFEEMKCCEKCWHIHSKSKVYNRKYHAGASNLQERSEISISFENPPGIKTNIDTPKIPVGDQTLYFFPDRALIYSKDGVGAVSYTNLTLRLVTHRFIEEGRLPSDAEEQGYTWRYVNKHGGQDMRFKNNYRIPVVLYEYVYLNSNSGLNECLCFSGLGATSNFGDALSALSRNAGIEKQSL